MKGSSRFCESKRELTYRNKLIHDIKIKIIIVKGSLLFWIGGLGRSGEEGVGSMNEAVKRAAIFCGVNSTPGNCCL